MASRETLKKRHGKAEGWNIKCNTVTLFLNVLSNSFYTMTTFIILNPKVDNECSFELR